MLIDQGRPGWQLLEHAQVLIRRLAAPTRCRCPRLLPQSAQRLKEERDELQQRLDQVGLEHTMGAALAETQVGAGHMLRG